MRHILIALQFLTILPIKIEGDITKKDYGESLLYFPLIGLIIGVILAASSLILSFLPHMVMAASILVISIVITGGIHLDGFADTCDGLYGGRSKKRILEIMHDSHLGAMGIIGITSLLILRFALIVKIPHDLLPKALIIMPLLSRWAQALLCLIFKYARDEGKAGPFIEHTTKREIIAGGVFTFIIIVLLIKGIEVLFIGMALMPALLAAKHIDKRIGGMTGDTIGALSEITEIGILLVFLLLI